MWRWRFLRGWWVGIGVGRSNFKIGLRAGSGVVGVVGANFEIGTPYPRLRELVCFRGGAWE